LTALPTKFVLFWNVVSCR